MKNWLEGSGAHIGTATRAGLPTVVVVDSATVVGDDHVRFVLSPKQVEHVRKNIEENPQVAFGPGGLGSIRAAYQFKGKAKLDGQALDVLIEEVYCTKPGPEAALRLDTLPHDALVQFETSRWKDQGPPTRKAE
jgi:predicted pyridoxine 5'-phosphate oxidase superfamily flavin-nucleotide-binding protein